MKDILSVAQELKRIFDIYCAKINQSNNPVFIPSRDINGMKILLEDLRKKTVSISPTISKEFADIKQNLFVVQGPGIATLNPYRFGALGATLRYLLSDEFICDSAKFICTPWQDVNDALKKLLTDANSVNTRIDYNQVGVAAREIYILLARKVFTADVRSASAAANISSADAKGMLNAFFDYKATDDDVKKYAKEAIKLAEPLTHTKSENEGKMRSVVMAVISLVGIVNAVFQSE